MGRLVEEATRKREVAGSNPIGRVARDFYAKKYATCDFPKIQNFFFPIFIKWRFYVLFSIITMCSLNNQMCS